MKVTRRQLKQLIKEEIGRLNEQEADSRWDSLDSNKATAMLKAAANAHPESQGMSKIVAGPPKGGLDADDIDFSTTILVDDDLITITVQSRSGMAGATLQADGEFGFPA